MKKLFIFAILLLLASLSYSQAPQKINYQGVARTNTGEIIPEQAVGLRVSILHNTPTGASQYVETHSLTTNQLGLFTASIGGGSQVSGNFSNITWGSGDKYLKIEIDPAGGNNYTLAGTFQLLSVPYALQSRNAEQIQGNPISPTPPNDEQVLVWDAGADAWVPADQAASIVYTAGTGININGSNQISNTAPDQVVTITGTGVSTVSGTYPNFTVNTPAPLDNSPTNELQTLSLNGSNLTLSNGGGTVTLPTAADGSATNEGSLTVGAGSATTSIISSNTSGSTDVTISAGAGIGTGEAGNVITITNTGDTDASNDLTTATNFNGDVTGVFNNIQLVNGVVGATELASTSVTAGSYTSANITVDADGRITAASNGIGGSGVSDGDKGDITVSSAGTVWDVDNGVIGPAEIASTSVTPGSYTAANITVDADGRITAASNGTGGATGHAIRDDGTTMTQRGKLNFVSSATVDAAATDDSVNDETDVTFSILNGAIGANQLASTSVSPGSYTLASITVDSDGRVTAASSGAETDGSITNEIQTLSLNGTTLSLSLGGGQVELPQSPVYTAGPGIQIAGNQISNTGDLNAADDITNATLAGGDLNGLYPNPTVDGLRGNPISATAPSLGQVLQWDGNAWTPVNVNAQSNGWLLTGNAGTDTLSNFIGTIDERPILFRVNNTRVGKLSRNDGNIFFGVQAGQNNTIGNSNSAYGFQTLFANTEGSGNTALGVQSLYANTIGQANTAVGLSALASNTEGEFNVAVGVAALLENTIGTLNTALGSNALLSNTEGELNTATGVQALASNTLGIANTATGVQALANNTIGEANTAAGVQSLANNTEGNLNTAMGVAALFTNTTGSENTAVGEEALFSNTTGEDNTAIGFLALYANTIGHDNVATGFQTLATATTGNYNTGTGNTALALSTTGSNNTANGFQALANTSTGNNNTAIGSNAGFTNSTGSNNTIIGGNANTSIGTLANSTALGNAATVNANNKIRFGNASVTVVEGQVAYSFPSDARFKFNVKEEVKGLEFIKLLRPVNYQFDTRKFEEFLTENMSEEARRLHFDGVDFNESTGIMHTGFIAQEVEQAAQEAGYEFDGVHVPVNASDNYSVSYSQFVVPLVKAVQEQQTMIEEQSKEIAQLKAELAEIKALLKGN